MNSPQFQNTNTNTNLITSINNYILYYYKDIYTDIANKKRISMSWSSKQELQSLISDPETAVLLTVTFTSSYDFLYTKYMYGSQVYLFIFQTQEELAKFLAANIYKKLNHPRSYCSYISKYADISYNFIYVRLK